jgi:phosphoenolpyruvate synthase/pyruvate phosphate dikinase
MIASTNEWVVPLSAVGPGDLPRVGGKGVNLGAMIAAGLPVPSGFCVTTAAFDRFVAQDAGMVEALAELDRLDPDDLEGVRARAGRLRARLGELPVPPEVLEAVRRALQAAGPEHAYAVRSSATLEDLPQASFAGQQDTHLQVRGATAIEPRVRDCWASLFTDRAVLYRRQHGFPSRAARLAVVVQRMVASDVSGILFTADPVTGHRGVCSIDASYGLGEALVSGLVDADLYRLDKATGVVLEARVGAPSRARCRPRTVRGAASPIASSPPCSSSQTPSRRCRAARRISSGASRPASCGCCRRGRSPRCSRSPRQCTPMAARGCT